jgi:lysophospholipase L1-like esterase
MVFTQQILVYGDSVSWGIIPNTRQRLPFHSRWPGVLEQQLVASQHSVRVIEDCLNGRRTVWEDPFKPGRNGLIRLEQRMEVNSPLALVILMLGTNDFQSVHSYNACHAAQGIATLVQAIRRAPIEPGMPVPEILIVAPPAIRTPDGAVSPKFERAIEKSVGLAKTYKQVTQELACHFFDAGQVVTTSLIDSVHLDADQHIVLGRALAPIVGTLISPSTVSKK